MTSPENYMGRTGFIERHGLWGPDDAEHAAAALRMIEENDLEVVRLSFADQHGLLRGKSVVAEEVEQIFRNGCTNTTTLIAKDTAHKTQFPVFSPIVWPFKQARPRVVDEAAECVEGDHDIELLSAGQGVECLGFRLGKGAG